MAENLDTLKAQIEQGYFEKHKSEIKVLEARTTHDGLGNYPFKFYQVSHPSQNWWSWYMHEGGKIHIADQKEPA